MASLTKKKIHYPFEDRDMMRLFVQAGGDALLETGEVSIFLSRFSDHPDPQLS